MLKKLRIKFIALNMATVAVVLAVVFTAICVINYQQSVGRVYEALDGSLASLAHGENGGGSGSGSGSNGSGTLGRAVGEVGAVPDGQAPQGTPPEIGGRRNGSDPLIPVAVYAVGEDGSLSTAATAKTTASIADDVLTEAASQLSEAPDGTGSLDGLGLYYAKRLVGDQTYLAFADLSAASGWQSLALSLAGVGAVALLAFFVISLFFSRWALRPVERSWTQQRRFVADASHELKTPLTVILANSSILLEHPERSIASESQWVESTQTEAERMQQLVGDLLLLARLDEGVGASTENASASERIDLADLVEGDLLQFESVAFERNVDLESSLEAGVAVRGDASRLHRLVSTLIDNACKYADDGGGVDVKLRRTPQQVELSVHNTGPAIAADDLPHVFDRFYRADKARTRDDGSYGLGLAIARAVAEEHDGTIAVTSNDAQGTTFTVTLPPAN